MKETKFFPCIILLVGRMKEKRNTHIILVGKLKRKSHLERFRSRQEGDTVMDIRGGLALDLSISG